MVGGNKTALSRNAGRVQQKLSGTPRSRLVAFHRNDLVEVLPKQVAFSIRPGLSPEVAQLFCDLSERLMEVKVLAFDGEHCPWTDWSARSFFVSVESKSNVGDSQLLSSIVHIAKQPAHLLRRHA
jgi:hypothetical protein